MEPEIQQLALQLSTSAARNGASLVTGKVQGILAGKRDREAVTELQEIIQELLEDKAEILGIAQAYQEQLVAQRITDEDVEYIVGSVVPLVKQIAENGGVSEEQMAQLVPILEPLVSVETVQVLQMFGFNFRRGIGEPLTELVAGKIASAGREKETTSEALTLAQMQLETAAMNLAMDDQAAQRFQRMFRS